MYWIFIKSYFVFLGPISSSPKFLHLFVSLLLQTSLKIIPVWLVFKNRFRTLKFFHVESCFWVLLAVIVCV